jgi:phosphotransferase system enzyme I (PtsI)
MASLRGIAASPGVAVGRAFRPLRADAPAVAAGQCPAHGLAPRDPSAEIARFKAAMAATKAELAALRDRARFELGDLKAEIFEAHLTIAADPELADEVAGLIEGGKDAASALDEAIAGFAALLAAEGGVFGARADDLRDLAGRVKAALSGAATDPWAGMPEGAVVLAEDLLPSETLRMDRAKVVAILTSGGSSGSHSSIIARSMEIPAVVGLGGAVLSIPAGSLVAVDGSAGLVVPEPGPAELASFAERREAWLAGRELARRFARLPTLTRDGHALELGANIGGPAEVEAALEAGAEGVGLFRTEFMFMDRSGPPSEDEQYAAYRHVLERMEGRTVTIRTLDAGGDKPVAGLPANPEGNPFLGVRAIRLCLAHEDIFRTQLRALLRAGSHGRLRIMIPMVAVLDELRAARRILEEEAAALEAAGASLGPRPELGIMIEIPAAALDAERLAREADFFSIGTNDLVQYLMAADRMNPGVAGLNRPLHPVVLRLIASVAKAARAHGRKVAVCGEMAADPRALPVLAGLGIHELSMSPALIPAARARLADLDLAGLEALAAGALEEEDEGGVARAIDGETQPGGMHHGS